MKYQIDTMLASAIKDLEHGTPGKEEQLVNVCRPCCNISDEDEDHTILMTMDGNMQRAELKRHTVRDFQIFKPKLCERFSCSSGNDTCLNEACTCDESKVRS